MSSPTGNEPGSHLAAVPEPPEAVGSEGPAEAPVEAAPVAQPAPEEDDRVSRPLFLLVLLGFLVCAIGFGVQSQRVGGFQAEIGVLEGEVLGLSSELERANERVMGFEAQRQQIQRSVQLIIEDILALEAVVASDPVSGAPTAPQDALSDEAAAASPLP